MDFSAGRRRRLLDLYGYHRRSLFLVDRSPLSRATTISASLSRPVVSTLKNTFVAACLRLTAVPRFFNCTPTTGDLHIDYVSTSSSWRRCSNTALHWSGLGLNKVHKIWLPFVRLRTLGRTWSAGSSRVTEIATAPRLIFVVSSTFYYDLVISVRHFSTPLLERKQTIHYDLLQAP